MCGTCPTLDYFAAFCADSVPKPSQPGPELTHERRVFGEVFVHVRADIWGKYTRTCSYNPRRGVVDALGHSSQGQDNCTNTGSTPLAPLP